MHRGDQRRVQDYRGRVGSDVKEQGAPNSMVTTKLWELQTRTRVLLGQQQGHPGVKQLGMGHSITPLPSEHLHY